jgi:hypothetical protein
MTDYTTPPRARKSLLELLTDVPRLVSELVRAELAQMKAEVIGKLKSLGLTAAMFAVAAVVLLLMVTMLLTSAVLALALVMPGWAAALVVAGVLLLIAAALVLIGYKRLKDSAPPVPTDTIESVKLDVDVVRGVRRGPHVRRPAYDQAADYD